METKIEMTVNDSFTENTHLVMAEHINGYGRLFGGVLMQWIDEVAGTVARRHCRTLVTTACVDNLNFKNPAYNGDTVVLVGYVTYTGNTSLEVQVDTYVEKLDGTRYDINTAYLVMVAVDEEGKAIPVPQIVPETESQKELWEMAKKRYELRKQRRKEGY